MVSINIETPFLICHIFHITLWHGSMYGCMHRSIHTFNKPIISSCAVKHTTYAYLYHIRTCVICYPKLVRTYVKQDTVWMHYSNIYVHIISLSWRLYIRTYIYLHACMHCLDFTEHFNVSIWFLYHTIYSQTVHFIWPVSFHCPVTMCRRSTPGSQLLVS